MTIKYVPAIREEGMNAAKVMQRFEEALSIAYEWRPPIFHDTEAASIADFTAAWPEDGKPLVFRITIEEVGEIDSSEGM